MKFIALAALTLITMLIPVDGASASGDIIIEPGHGYSNNRFGADRGVVWISESTGYLVYRDTNLASADLLLARTLDGGKTWGTPTQLNVHNAQNVLGFDVFYDRWREGDTGNLLHIVYAHSGSPTRQLRIAQVNTITGNIVRDGVIVNGITSGSVGNVSVVKTDGGKLYARFALTTDAGSGLSRFSNDGGIVWNTITDFTSPFLGGYLAPAKASPVFFVGVNDVFSLNTDGEILHYQSSTDSWSRIFNPASAGITPNDRGRSMAFVPNSGTVAAASSAPLNFYSYTCNGSTAHDELCVLRQNNSSVVTQVTSPWSGLPDAIINGGIIWDATRNRLYAYMSRSDNVVRVKYSLNFGTSWSSELIWDDNSTAVTKLFSTIGKTITPDGGLIYITYSTSAAPFRIHTNLTAIPEFNPVTPEPIEDGFIGMLNRFVAGIGFVGASGRLWFAIITSGMCLTLALVFRAPLWAGVAVTGMYSSLMVAVGYISPGLYLSAVVIFAIMAMFLVIRTISGGNSGEDF